MSDDLREEMMRYVPRTDEPEIRARQRHVVRIVLDMDPELRKEVTAEGRQEGRLEGRQEGREEGRLEGRQEGRLEGRQEGREEERERALTRLFERRLGRALTGAEHQALDAHRAKLGPERLYDVVLDLGPEALAAWLADPKAT